MLASERLIHSWVLAINTSTGRAAGPRVGITSPLTNGAAAMARSKCHNPCRMRARRSGANIASGIALKAALLFPHPRLMHERHTAVGVRLRCPGAARSVGKAHIGTIAARDRE